MKLTRQAHLQDITKSAFTPFGHLLETPGRMTRVDFAAEVANFRPSARANLALVRAGQAPERITIREMERHPLSTQAFFPLEVSEYLVIVAPGDGSGAPLLDGVAAFRVLGKQGISYNVGVWHCGMTALGGAGLFAMLVFEDGSPDDTQVRPVEPFEVLCRRPE
jgi:ureidoglycolate lyase